MCSFADAVQTYTVLSAPPPVRLRRLDWSTHRGRRQSEKGVTSRIASLVCTRSGHIDGRDQRSHCHSAFDGQLRPGRRNGVAGILDSGDQVPIGDRAEARHLRLLRREFDAGAFETWHRFQRLFHASHAGRAVHTCDRQDDRVSGVGAVSDRRVYGDVLSQLMFIWSERWGSQPWEGQGQKRISLPLDLPKLETAIWMGMRDKRRSSCSSTSRT